MILSPLVRGPRTGYETPHFVVQTQVLRPTFRGKCPLRKNTGRSTSKGLRTGRIRVDEWSGSGRVSSMYLPISPYLLSRLFVCLPVGLRRDREVSSEARPAGRKVPTRVSSPDHRSQTKP